MAYHILMDRRTHSVSEYIMLLRLYMQHFANASLTEDRELKVWPASVLLLSKLVLWLAI